MARNDINKLYNSSRISCDMEIHGVAWCRQADHVSDLPDTETGPHVLLERGDCFSAVAGLPQFRHGLTTAEQDRRPALMHQLTAGHQSVSSGRANISARSVLMIRHDAAVFAGHFRY
jgi:hypothetical protein